jgi:hypothetical protein
MDITKCLVPIIGKLSKRARSSDGYIWPKESSLRLNLHVPKPIIVLTRQRKIDACQQRYLSLK